MTPRPPPPPHVTVEACPVRLHAAELVRAARAREPDQWERWAAGAVALFRPVAEDFSGCRVALTLSLDGQGGRCRVEWARKGRTGGGWVELLAVPSNVAGHHWRWRCPVRGTPAATLYLPPGAAGFASRAGHGLPYACQTETPVERAARRARKLREGLGERPPMLGGPLPIPPPRMTAARYLQMRDKIQAAEGIALAASSTAGALP